jgi:cell division protein FtsW
VDLKSVIDTRRRAEPDLALFILVLVLAGIGVAMSYSASAAFAIKTFGDALHFLKRQLAWIILGFAALMVVQNIDYKIYARYTRIMLLGALVLLALVLIPGLGHSAKGSARWLGMGGFGLQPSEFAKLAVVIYLAKVFSTEYSGVANHVAQILVPMIIVAILFVLIMMQPDFGTAITLLAVSVMILFVSGFPFMYILTLGVISIPMFYLLIYQVSYRRERIFAFLNPWKNRYGIGYHVIQSFTAFRKGGFLGEGLGNGTQKLGRLPEPHTDFIFAVIAEEAGLLGTLVIVGLFCALFWRGMVIALAAPDEFGRLLAMGLTIMLVAQAFTNIAVVTGSLPTTGIPLPFISYGGSSMLTSMIAVGILLNISRYREVVQENLKGGIEVWQ